MVEEHSMSNNEINVIMVYTHRKFYCVLINAVYVYTPCRRKSFISGENYLDCSPLCNDKNVSGQMVEYGKPSNGKLKPPGYNAAKKLSYKSFEKLIKKVSYRTCCSIFVLQFIDCQQIIKTTNNCDIYNHCCFIVIHSSYFCKLDTAPVPENSRCLLGKTGNIPDKTLLYEGYHD